MNLLLLNHPDNLMVMVTVGSLDYLDGLGSAWVTVTGSESWNLVLNGGLVLLQGWSGVLDVE